MKLSVDFLKAESVRYYAFGLGFYQFVLKDRSRFHFYLPDNEVSTEDEEVHNHRYSFVSEVLTGEIENFIYDFKPDKDGSHILMYSNCGVKSLPPNEDKEIGNLTLTSSFKTTKGEQYRLSGFLLHTIKTAPNTITYLVPSAIERDYASVVTKLDANPICPFSVKTDQDSMWEKVEHAISII